MLKRGKLLVIVVTLDLLADYRPSSTNTTEGHVRFVGVSPTPSPSAAPQSRDLESASFCEMFEKARENQAKLEITYAGGRLWQNKSKRMCLQIQNQEEILLNDLLVDNRYMWTLKDKWTLAVILAHAVLHGSEGPWLRDDWSKRHVSFFKKDGEQIPDLRRPFMTLDFDAPLEQSGAQDHLFVQHSNPTLLALGILLLEIMKGTHIELHWTPDDLTDGSQANENTNLTTAMRLLDQSNGDLVTGFRRAVAACLEWDDSSDQVESDFVNRMYEAIVEPLEYELEHGFQVTPESLHLMPVS
jgi:hypothetical protein